MFKNVATSILLFAFDTTTGAGKTGDAANILAYVCKDYGAVAALADITATEKSAANAPGWYQFDVTASEANANALLFSGKSSTPNVSVVGQYIFTTPNNFPAFVTPTGAAVGSVTGSVAGTVGGVTGNVAGSVGSVLATVNSNIIRVNNIPVSGTGTPADPWGP